MIRKLRKLRKHAPGFTLIELLIVIAIIGILAAIAIPNLLNALQRGKQKRTMADMRSLATAIESYQIDNNAYPTATCASGLYTTEGSTAVGTASFTLLRPTYIALPPYTDGWAHYLIYNVDTTGQNYLIASYGRNGLADPLNCGTTTDFNSDIVYADGTFIQWPEGPQQ